MTDIYVSDENKCNFITIISNCSENCDRLVFYRYLNIRLERFILICGSGQMTNQKSHHSH